MDIWEIILIICVAALVVCPPKWDPAIWLKDWTLTRNRRRSEMNVVDKVRLELYARQIRRRAFLSCFLFWGVAFAAIWVWS